jgi:hypothetical protein
LLSLWFKSIVAEAKGLFEGDNLLIRSSHGQFAVIAGSDVFNAKEWAVEQGLRGWGSDNLFQGKDENVLTVK